MFRGKRSARRFVASAVAIGASGALLAIGVSTASAATTAAPVLTGTVKLSTVTLTWAEPATAKRTVEIQRLDGTTWTALSSKTTSARRGSVKDTKATTLYATYRARVTENGVTSAWSASTTVDTTPPYEPGSFPCPSDYAARGIAALNAFRAANGADASQRAPVRNEIHLARLSTARASHLAHIQRLSHAGFSSNLYIKWGYTDANDGSIGENALAIGNPEQAISGWAGSPGHRANMLHRTIDAGFGCALDARGIEWYMLDMGVTILSPG